MARCEAGESTTSPTERPSRAPVMVQLRRTGSRTTLLSRAAEPSQVMTVLPIFTWKRSSLLGTPFSSSAGTSPTTRRASRTT